MNDTALSVWCVRSSRPNSFVCMHGLWSRAEIRNTTELTAILLWDVSFSLLCQRVGTGDRYNWPTSFILVGPQRCSFKMLIEAACGVAREISRQ